MTVSVGVATANKSDELDPRHRRARRPSPVRGQADRPRPRRRGLARRRGDVGRAVGGSRRGTHGPGTSTGVAAPLPLPQMTEPAPPPLLSNGDLARIFHEIGDMLEVKGEIVFKTVAYHQAADAIAHSPIEVSREYLARQAAEDRRRGRSHREEDRGTGPDRQPRLLREAPRRGAAEPGRAARDTRGRAADGETAPRRAGHRDTRRSPAGGPGGFAPRR